MDPPIESMYIFPIQNVQIPQPVMLLYFQPVNTGSGYMVSSMVSPEPQKKKTTRILSVTYWLVHDGILIMVRNNLHITGSFPIPLCTLNNLSGPFFHGSPYLTQVLLWGSLHRYLSRIPTEKEKQNITSWRGVVLNLPQNVIQTETM